MFTIDRARTTQPATTMPRTTTAVGMGFILEIDKLSKDKLFSKICEKAAFA
jgi:hypothetical protein